MIEFGCIRKGNEMLPIRTSNAPMSEDRGRTYGGLTGVVELKDYMERVAALVHEYVPLDP